MSGRETITLALVKMACSQCSVRFAVPEDFDKRRRQDGRTFYCPNGHGQVYRETEVQRLARQRDSLIRQRDFANERARQNREWAEQEKRRAAAQKGQVTKLKKRAAAGVCPCCNRTFQNLARHMKSKHPDFSEAL